MWIFLIILSASLAHSKLNHQISADDHLIDVSVNRLTTDNFHRLTGITLPFKPENGKPDFETDWFVVFYSPTCPHCKKALPEWNEFARASLTQRIASRYKVKIGAVDCKQNHKLCDGFDLQGYPTFLYFSTDYKKYQFSGQRTKENFLKYINQQTLDPTKTFFAQQEPHPFDKFLKCFTKTSITIIFILLILVGMLLYSILDPLGTQLQHYFQHPKYSGFEHEDLLKVK